MPQVEVDRLTLNYDAQGEGEPLLLIPNTAADHACCAFQLPAYTELFAASQSTFPARARATAGRAVLDRGLHRPGRRLPRRNRD
jgi:hypothetical protein